MRLMAALFVGAGLLAPAPTLLGQTVGERVARVGEGRVRMSFAARPEVCGNGRSISIRGNGERRYHRDADWYYECEDGPVRLVLRMDEGQVTDIDTYVGGSWRPAGESVIDLGTVGAAEAVDYLVSLARGAKDEVGEKSLFAASLADSVELWPELLVLAKDEALPGETRKAAIMVLSQEVGEAAAAGLTEIVYDEDDDIEVREAAVFALSRRPADEAVPTLIGIVRNNADPRLVRSAIFWLGQIDDPRVLEFYEEILTKG